MAGGVKDIQLSRNALLAIVTVVGLATIAMMVFFLIPEDTEKQPEEPEQAIERPSAPPLRPQDLAAEEGPQAAATDPLQTQAVTAAARGFTDEWLRTDRSKATWLSGMKEYGTGGFNRELALVREPSDIPAQQRSGEPKEIQRGLRSSTVTVPLNSGELTLRFNYTDGAWLIASYEFEVRSP
ncbi:MAG: hypothetical protein ACRDPW_10860 [Mycobacteriales bacterium]